MSPDLEWMSHYRAEDVADALAPFLTDARRERIEEVLNGRLGGLRVAFEDLFDPHNGAAAIRTAEAFGVYRIHAAQPTTSFKFAEKVARGAKGWVELHRHRSIGDLAARLREGGFQILGAVVDAERPLEEHDFSRPTALLFGNEHAGLSPEAEALLDARFTLPMHGFTESFNLSVSVALALQVAAGGRRQALGRPGDLDDRERTALRARYYAVSVDRRAALGMIERHLAVSNRTR